MNKTNQHTNKNMNTRDRKTTVYQVLPSLKKLWHEQSSRVGPYRKAGVLEDTLILYEQPQEKQNRQLIMIKGRLLAIYLYLFELFYILSK